MTTKSRAYCLTQNNYDDSHVELFKSLKYRYIIIGNEHGSENNTPHLQVYVYFPNPLSFDSIKKKFPKAHIEAAKGNAMQNREYCSKEQILFEDGEIPVQGKRTDFDTVREILNETSSMEAVVDQAQSNQTIKFAATYLKYKEAPRPIGPIEFIWIYGSTGTGKTRYAYENYPELFEPYDFAHWEGYDAHETVLLNDFRKDFCKFHELLRLSDIYPYRVRALYGTRQAHWKTLIITTPLHPEDLYDTREDTTQLLRRITKIIKMTPDEDPIIEKINLLGPTY
jgi:hypothetical protein